MTPTPSATGVATNQPPVAPPLQVFTSFAGHPLEVNVEVWDPEGDSLSYEVVFGPRTMVLRSGDGFTRLFWLPMASDLGAQFVRVRATEIEQRGRSVDADFLFDVRWATGCESVRCQPNQGCTASLAPLGHRCCDEEPRWPRPSLAKLPCPQGRGLWVGRNLGDGFGTIGNCDRFKVINFGQIGAVVRLNLAVRCLDTSEPLELRAEMRTAERELFSAARAMVRVKEGEDGFARRFALAFPVRGPGPFFEFEDAEAELSLAVKDAAGQTLETKLRLLLTFDELPDLPDPPLVEPPWERSRG